MIKQINTGVAELIAVKVPDDAYNFVINNIGCLRCSIKQGTIEINEPVLETIDMCFDNYQLLGIAHELTEEVWDSVLPEARRLYFDTPSISGLSLLEANEVYAVNPYGNKEPEDIEHLGAFTQMMRQKHREWKKCQQNVGKWVLPKKIEG